jgi:hypothetical protein
MIKLYLDIDGVLLTAKHTRAADGVEEFISFVTTHFECYWLTTHCKGDSKPAIKYLSQFISLVTIEKLTSTVRPTNWDVLKTEAIDFQSDFYWLEDNPFQSEIACLQINQAIDKLILVDLSRPHELLATKERLMETIYS